MMIFSKPSPAARAALVQNLAILIKSGIPLSESLGLLIEESRSRRMRLILQKVLNAIRGGTSLGDAFAQHHGVFGNVFIQVIKAGEASGTLEENLSFLGRLLNEQSDLRTRVRAALLYPEIVLVMAIALSIGLSFFILPRLHPLFVNIGVSLPLPTRILLGFTKFLSLYWGRILFAIIGAVMMSVFLRRIKAVQHGYHRFLLKFPVAGPLIQKYQLALICQVFSTLYGSGLSIIDILESGADATTNSMYRGALKHALKRVSTGVPISRALADWPELFSRNFLTILAVGEKSGTLEQSFRHLTDLYTKEVDDRIKKLPVILEPVLLIGIGLVVGFVALSVILPVYQLTQGFQPK